ncbi:MAG: ribonuclease R [Planctomycetaceae bacterium]|jgi:ribonuclease R|nr:ribonuclease R [Planctomycetaceae bacterium]
MSFDSDAVRKAVLQIVSEPDYRPQKPKKFLEPLNLFPDDARPFRLLIRGMVAAGELCYGKNHFVFKAGNEGTEPNDGKAEQNVLRSSARTAASDRPAAGLITGRFQRRPSGIGFVRPRDAGENAVPSGDIFIPAHWTKDAASGDTVAVAVSPSDLKNRERRSQEDYRGSTKGRLKRYADDEGRGRVVEIIERASNRFVGTYRVQDGWGYIQVDGSVFKQMIPVGDASASPARQGDKVVIEMIKYPTPYNDGEAVIVEVLGQHGVPGLDTLLIMRQFDLPEQFSASVLAAARKEVEKFIKLDEKSLLDEKRLDLTDETIITIDPADAKDFDDAVSLEKLDNGHWKLGVHIADVAYFVTKNSPIDKEAAGRATSVYLPDRVIPMLPEVLSNALASLQPDKVRFAKSVLIEFTTEGTRVHTAICRSAIKSKQRFNYTEVQNFLEHPAKFRSKWKPEIRELLTDLFALMKTLRKCRLARGSLEMDIPEPKIDIDDDGAVVGAHVYPYHDSNRIIEECMLSANEAVADYLQERSIPFLRRIHSGPAVRKLRTFTDFIRSMEIADWDADDIVQDRFILQRLLSAAKGTDMEYAVNFSLLRSMQKAVYSPEPEGHYALASPCYCHFTSPIRRYPDLTIHRLLDSIIDGTIPNQDVRELVLQGEHCSDREQRAADAERGLVKLKLIDYMSKHIGERMEAVVTTVEQFGIFVMGTEVPAEGLIRMEGLNDDYYRFERQAKVMIGHKSGNVLRIGDRLLVECVRADADARQIDFRMVKRLPAGRRTSVKINSDKELQRRRA